MFALNFPLAFPALEATANFRVEPEDFFVDEHLGFEFSGNGEHLCLHVEKRNQNTGWVAGQLAAIARINPMDIGYCGLKDRHAVTRQWFSLYLGNRDLDWQSVQIEGCSILSAARHDKKLRRGMHARNTFRIRLRNVAGDHAVLDQRWQDIGSQGVPNYFGEQRFGHDGGNLQLAQELLPVHARIWRERKNQFAVSALRSYLFNIVLGDRVSNGDWRDCHSGDPQPFPTAPLWGRGRPLSSENLGEREHLLLAPYAAFCEKLEHLGLQQERRALLLLPEDVCAEREFNDWILTFSLPPGTYATSVLRELLVLKNMQPLQF
jgi:tRNA pseudouridine13 synthase